jgi:hypothetical protein
MRADSRTWGVLAWDVSKRKRARRHIGIDTVYNLLPLIVILIMFLVAAFVTT